MPLSQILTSLRNRLLGVLRGDVSPLGPVGIATLVDTLGDCIAQAEALERSRAPAAGAHQGSPLR